MPSNLDFDDKNKEQELKQFKGESKLAQEPQPIVELPNLTLKSYKVKGKTIFSLPPQYPVGSISPLSTPTFPIRDYSREERSDGIWGVWEKIIGYSKKQIQIDQGYLSLFSR